MVALGLLMLAVAAADVDIDKLCPPRPETAAQFRSEAHPPAARPYREAAKMAYRYMTSLPAMTVLVETGKPNQKYQHNAYVSKTHAAHIRAMLDWAKLEPEKRETAMRFAKASAEFLLKELEPADAPLAFWPPTYGRKPLEFDPKTDGPYKKRAMIGNEPEAAVKYRGEVMLLYPADVGSAFVDYWRETKDDRFLVAAKGIAETYLRMRRAGGGWPLKMKLATGEPVGENTLVPNYPMALFNALHDATGDQKWKDASDACFAWLEEHPLKDWNWDGQFEDIRPCKPYANPTKHNAVDTVMEILRRYPGDATSIAQCRKIMEFCEKRFVVWEAPENHPKWPAPSVLEQYSCFTPIDASAAKMISGYLAMYRAEGRAEDLAKARALADAVTRVQKPSGRIPTFWDGVNAGDSGLSNERYDWLNCMAAAAKSLTELSCVTEADCRLKKLGTYDMFIGEANPIVFKGRLLMMEYIRHMGPELRYRFNTTGKGYFRFRDLKDLKTFTPSFGVGLHMGNAFVAGDRVVVTAVEKWGGSRILQMESEDLEHWTEPRVILENPRWGVYNTTMCRAGDRYVLGFELGCPAELVGVPYTMFFAESRDLTNWSVVEGARMGADIYTGAPMLRHFGDWFYFFHLEGSYDKGFETRVMRSRDLFDWELSPKVVLGYDPWDKMIHPQATFTDEERATIAAAVDINASDFDMCEWQGKLIGFYSWGDQRGHEFSALTAADCSEREFCEGFFR